MANMKNNARSRASRRRIITAFVELLEARELEKVSVTEICARAKVNRATFYAHFDSVYDLADALKRGLEEQTADLYQGQGVAWGVEKGSYLEMLEHVRKHQQLYQTYFKLARGNELAPIEFGTFPKTDLETEEISEYRRMFRRAGIMTVVRLWLQGGCKETPEQVERIFLSEMGSGE